MAARISPPPTQAIPASDAAEPTPPPSPMEGLTRIQKVFSDIFPHSGSNSNDVDTKSSSSVGGVDGEGKTVPSVGTGSRTKHVPAPTNAVPSASMVISYAFSMNDELERLFGYSIDDLSNRLQRRGWRLLITPVDPADCAIMYQNLSLGVMGLKPHWNMECFFLTS
jgi:hypothetical protein